VRAIFDGDGSSFLGDIAPHGTSVTYEVPAFEAGTYQFQCDAHPAMHGAFIVS
jgi:plastocyanin